MVVQIMNIHCYIPLCKLILKSTHGIRNKVSGDEGLKDTDVVAKDA